MYIDKGSGLTVYESLDELLAADIIFMSEYNGFYYIRVNSGDYYDNSVWTVNKRTGEVSFIGYTEYFEIEDKAKEINPLTLKRAS